MRDTEAGTTAAAPPAVAGRNRMISPVIVVPMPIVSRMMNRIGSRIWLNSVSILTNHAVRPVTIHTLLMTRSTNVLTLPSVCLSRVSHISNAPKTGSTIHRIFHFGSWK
ncbi:unknown [Alistipes sp. CAG:29]|nr:unknown [Alistipes sp. CAG:29]